MATKTEQHATPEQPTSADGIPAKVVPGQVTAGPITVFTKRFIFGPGTGVFEGSCDCSDLGVQNTSSVVASISEWSPELNQPIIGAAEMRVMNVTPLSNGFVRIRVNHMWGSPISGIVTLFVSR